MGKKTMECLEEATTWIETKSGSDVDTGPISHALKSAEKAVRDVADLKEKLAVASHEKTVSLLVLKETLKAAKHASKAREARESSGKDGKKTKESRKEADKAPRSKKRTS
ncbi:MAG: hypothetical protein EA426_04325 [Spirochaetaceae bacterium]|nr:MAG: hypothetical protein EA426_04325 [Spirochaetaceae bacterium]